MLCASPNPGGCSCQPDDFVIQGAGHQASVKKGLLWIDDALRHRPNGVNPERCAEWKRKNIKAPDD